ncbi:hypothetical protein BJV82DRAFT_587168 [Fennellomyces sp. T-0311]|nr:hypothetical protein BJV82DRAFT_587168 [Fennellomyces sp. T-0311]
MTKTELAPLPTRTFNIDPIQTSFNKVECAIDQHDYRQAVNCASATIQFIQQLLLLSVLDNRAYALGMQGHFDDAVKDAEAMITCKPTLPTGFIRLGNIYRMQGKQRRAIETYEIGLESVPPDDPQYPLLQEGKAEATLQNEKRIDFIARLPIEMVDYIMTQLPNESRAICLSISSVWRNKILDCAETWCTLETDDGAGDNEIISTMPHIAHHVQDLTVYTENRRVWLQYLLNMRSGHFRKIKSITLADTTSKHFSPSVVTSMVTAFWQLRATLTTLDLDFDENHATVTLADVLLVCTNLTKLVYTTLCPLSQILGDLTVLPVHSTLNDLQLEAQAIDGETIEPLLQQCPQMRRLVLEDCSDSVLDVVKQNCPRLKIFGYNSEAEEMVPSDYEEGHVLGIRAIYTSTCHDAIPTQKLLQLIKDNTETLDTLFADICPTDEEVSEALYSDVNLAGLKKLKYWSGPGGDGIERAFLQSISKCTSLTHFEAQNTTLTTAVTEALLALPPPETFVLAYTYDGSETLTGLTRLFKKYAELPGTQQNLQSVHLQNSDVVSDEVLVALAQIQTLKEVTLCGLDGITQGGIHKFFEAISKDVSSIQLLELRTVADSHLISLARIRNLTYINLDDLSEVTDYGVLHLVDNAKRLQKMRISSCTYVTQDAVNHIIQKGIELEE